MSVRSLFEAPASSLLLKANLWHTNVFFFQKMMQCFIFVYMYICVQFYDSVTHTLRIGDSDNNHHHFHKPLV